MPTPLRQIPLTASLTAALTVPQSVTLFQGEDVGFTFTMDVPTDVSLWAVMQFTVRHPLTGVAILTLVPVATDPFNGVWQATATNAMTLGQPAMGGYLWDFIRADYGAETVLATGTMTLEPGVSLVATVPPPATHFSVTSSTATPNPGVPFTVTVTALAANGETATTYAGVVRLTSTDGFATLPGNFTLVNGVGTASVTLAIPGAQTVTATDTVTSGITGNVVVTGTPAPLQTFGAALNQRSANILIPLAANGLDDILLLGLAYHGNCTFTVSDSAGNDWFKVGTKSNGLGKEEMWAAPGVKAGANTLTIHPSNAVNVSYGGAEYPGVYADPVKFPFDLLQGATGTGTAVNSGSMTPRFAGEVLFALATTDTAPTTLTPAAGWANLFSAPGVGSLADTFQGVGDLSNHTMDSGGKWIVALGAYSVTSGQAVAIANDSKAFIDTTVSDGQVQADAIWQTAGSAIAAVFFRCDAASVSNGWAIYLDGTNATLYEFTNNAATSHGSVAFALTPGQSYTAKAVYASTSIQVFLNGVHQVPMDTTSALHQTKTIVGLEYFHPTTGSAFANFSAAGPVLQPVSIVAKWTPTAAPVSAAWVANQSVPWSALMLGLIPRHATSLNLCLDTFHDMDNTALIAHTPDVLPTGGGGWIQHTPFLDGKILGNVMVADGSSGADTGAVVVFVAINSTDYSVTTAFKWAAIDGAFIDANDQAGPFVSGRTAADLDGFDQTYIVLNGVRCNLIQNVSSIANNLASANKALANGQTYNAVIAMWGTNLRVGIDGAKVITAQAVQAADPAWVYAGITLYRPIPGPNPDIGPPPQTTCSQFQVSVP